MKKQALPIVVFFALAAATSCSRSVFYANPVPDVVPSTERTFPADSGMLNVKTVYGAVGDGVHDDTAAIQAAISANIRQQSTSRIIYFPAGTDLVSKPLVWKDTTGVFQSELTFHGENQQSTVIKLTD